MWQFLKKVEKLAAIGLLIFGLSIPLLLFLNRVLLPDVSCDSLNYHLYLGFKGFNTVNDKFEFFPTGIHNFSPVLEMVGYGFYKILGYRLGTVFSIVALYLSILGIYKIFSLVTKKKIVGDLWLTFLFVSSFMSFELFLGMATYFNDVLVAMLTVWSVYFLLKYFENEKLVNLVLAAGMIGISVWGKQTNLYVAIAFGIVVIIDLILNRKGLNIRMRNVLMAGIIVISLPFLWYIKNWQATANPVFPFYNGIFKSGYFPPVNFHEPQFAGENLWQKIMWGYYSIFKPARLGQVHDLFHDFKINFYFIFGGILLAYYVFNKKIKDKLTSRLIIFFWLAMEIWSVQFGYLRYALAVEMLGGVLVLILFTKMGRWKYLVFVPVCIWLLVQNKRVVNLSLAYDISFRPGYFYNKESYPKNINQLFDNKLNIVNKDKADIYLNCSVTGMTYYVVSPYNNLPVLNIDQTAYKQMTDDKEYMAKQKENIGKVVKNGDIKFVTIGAKTGLNTEYNSCVANLVKRGWSINAQEDVDFVGYPGQKLGVIWGTIPKYLFDKIGE